MPVTPTIEVDDTLKERSSHGSFELPIETYTDNCQIFHSLYNHWHDEMELIYIESGSGLVRLNKEILRVKSGDLIIVNRGVLHGIKTDLKNILYFRSIVLPYKGRYNASFYLIRVECTWTKEMIISRQ